MCLAIFKPAKASIPEEHLRQGWQHNSDGAGFAYLEKGKVVPVKGLLTLKEFLQAYTEKVNKYKTSPFMIHFRIRSMGEKSADNTHPFAIPGGAMIHNGTLTGTGATYQSGPSDTAIFANKYGSCLDYITVNKNLKEWNEALDYNKMVMLYDNGKYIIINEKDGVWENDVWYSNSSFKYSKPSMYSTWGEDEHLITSQKIR